jgi:hypothetical protein
VVAACAILLGRRGVDRGAVGDATVAGVAARLGLAEGERIAA